VVYVATDILGGMRYPGYSFASQMVSELMAIGAPSEDFVDPLFLLYGGLVLAFGVGVYLEGLGRSRALRIAGVLLVMYAAFGFTGPTLFEMPQRGTGTLTDAVPHIVVTGVLVVLSLLATGLAGFALSKRFRLYSLATISVMIGLGALGGPYGARLAAGQPTPGFGIIERVDIYASMLWVAVLGVILLRRQAAESGALPATTLGQVSQRTSLGSARG
jgi:hypothetical protein